MMTGGARDGYKDFYNVVCNVLARLMRIIEVPRLEVTRYMDAVRSLVDDPAAKTYEDAVNEAGT